MPHAFGSQRSHRGPRVRVTDGGQVAGRTSPSDASVGLVRTTTRLGAALAARSARAAGREVQAAERAGHDAARAAASRAPIPLSSNIPQPTASAAPFGADATPAPGPGRSPLETPAPIYGARPSDGTEHQPDRGADAGGKHDSQRREAEERAAGRARRARARRRRRAREPRRSTAPRVERQHGHDESRQSSEQTCSQARVFRASRATSTMASFTSSVRARRRGESRFTRQRQRATHGDTVRAPASGRRRPAPRGRERVDGKRRWERRRRAARPRDKNKWDHRIGTSWSR